MTTGIRRVVTLEVSGLPEDFRLIDPMDGSVYAVPEKNIERVASRVFAARTAGARLPAAADLGQEFLRGERNV